MGFVFILKGFVFYIVNSCSKLEGTLQVRSPRFFTEYLCFFKNSHVFLHNVFLYKPGKYFPGSATQDSISMLNSNIDSLRSCAWTKSRSADGRLVHEPQHKNVHLLLKLVQAREALMTNKRRRAAGGTGGGGG